MVKVRIFVSREVIGPSNEWVRADGAIGSQVLASSPAR